MTTGKEPEKQNKGFLQRLLHYTKIVEDGLLVFMLAAMIIIASLQILLRNVWDSGFAWGDPLLRILVLWVGLLGAMVATRKDNHISIDILTRYMPARGKRVSGLLSNIFTLGVCVVLAYQGGRFVMQDQAAGIIAFSGLPVWWFELIIPVAFAMMSLRYAVRCITDVQRQS